MHLNRFLPLAAALLFSIPALGQGLEEHSEIDINPANDAFLEAWLADFDDISDKLNQMADAFSADQYDWIPDHGKRSVRQLFLHTMAANLAISKTLRDGSEINRMFVVNAENNDWSKEEIIVGMLRGQEYVRETINELTNTDLSSHVVTFGPQMTYYRVLMILAGHSNEHLGQAMAYAIPTGAEIPWEAEREEN